MGKKGYGDAPLVSVPFLPPQVPSRVAKISLPVGKGSIPRECTERVVV